MGARKRHEVHCHNGSNDNDVVSKAEYAWAMADHPAVDTVRPARGAEEPEKDKAMV